MKRWLRPRWQVRVTAIDPHVPYEQVLARKFWLLSSANLHAASCNSHAVLTQYTVEPYEARAL